MKRFLISINIFSLLILGSLAIPGYGTASVDLPWSTSFNCGEWDQVANGYDSVTCDGLQGYGSWTCNGKGEQITAAANYPNGGGGLGQRHWMGNGKDLNGTAPGSGSLQIVFNSPPSEIWMRYYVRYEAGFPLEGQEYHKLLYLFPATGYGFYVDSTGGGNGIRIITGGTERASTDYGFDDIYGAVSDGSWHCFEYHFNLTSGVFEIWVDGVQRLSASNVFYPFQAIHHIVIPENHKTTSLPRDMYYDIDDIAVSTTGYIGPLSPTIDTQAPTVSITAPTGNQSVSGNISVMASSSDDVGTVGVQFKIDGNDIGTEDASSPYSVNLDTTEYSDGAHSLTAVARDAAGNERFSTPVAININNSSGADSGGTAENTVLIDERFEDANFTGRGWYDNTNILLSSSQHLEGSARSAEFRFEKGATTPTSGGALRKLFAATDSVYVSYYVQYSSNWDGSNQSYHPHEFYLLTNKDGDWSNLSRTHLTTYIEENEGVPLVGIQDALNIDQAKVGQDLTYLTENRSVAGCNGDSDSYPGSCYAVDSTHMNWKEWRASKPYLQDVSSQSYQSGWHHVEVYLKMNSIADGSAKADGIVKYWIDGNPVIDHSDVVFRTGQNADMKFNQFVVAPYIGDGSPVTQSFWIDNLLVSTARPANGDQEAGALPSAPSNLRLALK